MTAPLRRADIWGRASTARSGSVGRAAVAPTPQAGDRASRSTPRACGSGVLARNPVSRHCRPCAPASRDTRGMPGAGCGVKASRTDRACMPTMHIRIPCSMCRAGSPRQPYGPRLSAAASRSSSISQVSAAASSQHPGPRSQHDPRLLGSRQRGHRSAQQQSPVCRGARIGYLNLSYKTLSQRPSLPQRCSQPHTAQGSRSGAEMVMADA